MSSYLQLEPIVKRIQAATCTELDILHNGAVVLFRNNGVELYIGTPATSPKLLKYLTKHRCAMIQEDVRRSTVIDPEEMSDDEIEEFIAAAITYFDTTEVELNKETVKEFLSQCEIFCGPVRIVGPYKAEQKFRISHAKEGKASFTLRVGFKPAEHLNLEIALDGFVPYSRLKLEYIGSFLLMKHELGSRLRELCDKREKLVESGDIISCKTLQ
jgi:hypothetical protein